MAAKILVIDDDAGIRMVIERYLKANGYAVAHASSSRDGLAKLADSRPDLVLLDAELPDGSGIDLCRSLARRKEQAPPVIMMSGSRVQDNDVLSGLSGGADDYVLKPFALAVLQARIEAVLRRYQTTRKTAAKLRKSGIELDAAGRTVTVDRKRLTLTRKEFDLLAILLGRSGRVLSVPFLLETVWGYDPADYNDPGTVEVHVFHLRKKLGKLGRHIVNLAGVGYKFEERLS